MMHDASFSRNGKVSWEDSTEPIRGMKEAQDLAAQPYLRLFLNLVNPLNPLTTGSETFKLLLAMESPHSYCFVLATRCHVHMHTFLLDAPAFADHYWRFSHRRAVL